MDGPLLLYTRLKAERAKDPKDVTVLKKGDRVELQSDIVAGKGSRTKHRFGTVIAISKKPGYVYVQQDGCSRKYHEIWHQSFWKKLKHEK